MDKEISTALIYLGAAYSLTWLILFVYLVFLGRKTRQVEKELRNLKEILEDKS